MRYIGLALIGSAVVLGACGGGGGDTSQTSQPPAQGGAPAATATAMPVTGQMHTINMIGDASGAFKFEPKTITIQQGDGLKFVAVSGLPHNVAFPAEGIPDDVEAQLHANMSKTESQLMSPLLVAANDSIVVSFAGIKPGTYQFTCPIHIAMQMTGSVTVQ